MSITGNKGLGIPTMIIHEAEGLIVQVETKNGELYRGLLTASEDNMNLHMKNVQYTNESGVTRFVFKTLNFDCYFSNKFYIHSISQL